MATHKRKPRSRVDRTGRTKGEARHIRLYHWMLDSPAYTSLSLAARGLLVEVWKRHNGTNNGEISYSVREAGKAINVGKNTAHEAFRELEAKGFLKARQRGSFDWKGGNATTWEITAEPYRDNLASKEFMSWRPEKQNPVPERGTTGPPRRDHGTQTKARIVSHGPPQRDHAPRARPPDGPPERDTSSLPSGATTDAMQPHAQSDPSPDQIDLTIPEFLDRQRWGKPVVNGFEI